MARLGRGIPRRARVAATVATYAGTPTATLVDDFSGSLATLWSFDSVTIVGGRARLTCNTGYNGIYSAATYTVRNSSVFARVYPPAAGGGSVVVVEMKVDAGGGGGTHIQIVLDVATGQLSFNNAVGYSDPNSVSITYDPVAHAWWRIRESAGTLFWETSPDSVTWTNRRTSNAATPAWVNSGMYQVVFNAHRDAGTTDYAEIDNVNVNEVSATVGMSGAGSLTVTPSLSVTGGPTMAGSGTLTVTPSRTVPSTVTMAGSGGLAVTPTKTSSGSLSMSGSGSLTVTPLVTHPPTVTFAGTAALTVTALLTRSMTVTMAGTGALAVTAATWDGVQVSGTTLTKKGVTWVPNGATMNGAPVGGLGERVGNINLAVNLGLNMIRLTDWIDTAGTLGVAEYDSTRWAAVDDMVARAADAGLVVELDLSCFRNLLLAQSSSYNPYTYNWTTFLTWVANRTNTVTGKRYGNDSTISFIGFAGETSAPDHSGSIARGITDTQLVTFYDTVMTLWGTLGQQVRIPGGLFFLSDTTMPWDDIFSLASCDLPAIHSYSTDDENYQDDVAALCATLGKPWLLEEFGFAAGNYGSDSARATDFTRQYNLAKTTNGAVGVIWWNCDIGTIDPNTQPLTTAAIRAKSSRANTGTYQYFRFAPTAIRTPSDTLVQMSEWALLNGSTQLYGAVASATNQSGASYEGPDKAADRDTGSKWLSNNGITSTLIFDMGRPTLVTGYRWATGNDSTGRDPVQWVISGSIDGSTWVTLDIQTSPTVTTSRSTYTSDFALPVLGSVTMSGAGTLTVTPTVTHPAAVTMAGAGSLAVTALKTTSVAVTMAGTGSLTVTPALTVTAAATMAGAGSLAVTSTITRVGTVTMAGAGALAVTGQDTTSGAVTMAGAGTLAVTPSRTVPGTVTMAGSGTMVVTTSLTPILMRSGGTVTSGSAAVTAVNPVVPATASAGDLTVITVVAKPYDTVITTPSGWTKIVQATNGTDPTTAADNGSMLVAVYVKESATPGAIGNLTQSGANSMSAFVGTFSKDPSQSWDTTLFATGGDTSSDTSWSVTADTILPITAGDLVLVSTGGTVDTVSFSGSSLTATGATLGTLTAAVSQAISTGNDHRVVGVYAPVTAGPATGPLVYTATAGAATTGTTVFFVLRQSSVATVTSGVNMDGTGGMAVTSAQSLPSAVTMAGSGTLTVTGSGSSSGTVTMGGGGGLTVTPTVTHSAAVTMAGAGSLTVTGVATPTGAVLMAGDGGLFLADQPPDTYTDPYEWHYSPPPLITHPATVTMAGSGEMSATGIGSQSATVTMAGTGSLTVTGSITRVAAATMAGTGALTVTAGVTHPASVAMAGPGSLTVAPAIVRVGSVTMTGSGTLAATGLGTTTGGATMAGSGVLIVTGTTAPVGSVLMTGSGTLILADQPGDNYYDSYGDVYAPPPLITHPATVTMSGSGGMTATVTGSQSATATMTGSGALAVTPTKIVTPTVTLAGTGTLAVTGQLSVPGTVSMAGSGALAVTPTITRLAAVTVAGTGTLTVTGTTSSTVSVSMSGSGGLAVTPLVTHPTTVTMTGTGALAVTVAGSQSGTATMAGAGALTVTATAVRVSPATMAGSGTLTVTPTRTIPSTLPFAGVGTLTITGYLTGTASVPMVGSGELTVDPSITIPAVTTMAGSGTLTVTATSGPSMTVTMTGQGDLAVEPTTVNFRSALMAGAGTLTVTGTRAHVSGALLTGSGIMIVYPGSTAGAGIITIGGPRGSVITVIGPRRRPGEPTVGGPRTGITVGGPRVRSRT